MTRGRTVLVVLATLALGVAVSALSCARRQAQAPKPEQPHLRLMTYNVNFGMGGDASTLRAITELGADVVLLQETTPDWELALEAELDERYPHRLFRHCCGAGGMAVLSEYPILAEETIPAPDGGWFPGWRLELDSPLGRLQVLNVHLRPQVSDGGGVVSGILVTPPVRRAQIEAYYNRLRPELPTLVVGDFNEGARGGAIEFLAARGFKTGLPEYHGSARTWRWNTSLGEVSSQLDHVLYDQQLDALDVHVMERGRSDHFPVLATIVRR